MQELQARIDQELASPPATQDQPADRHKGSPLPSYSPVAGAAASGSQHMCTNAEESSMRKGSPSPPSAAESGAAQLLQVPASQSLREELQAHQSQLPGLQEARDKAAQLLARQERALAKAESRYARTCGLQAMGLGAPSCCTLGCPHLQLLCLLWRGGHFVLALDLALMGSERLKKKESCAGWMRRTCIRWRCISLARYEVLL